MWDFAGGCMRTYLILKDKAQQFAAHAEIQALLAEIRGQRSWRRGGPVQSQRAPQQLKAAAFDRQALASRRLPYERLDQLVVDLLLGRSQRMSAACRSTSVSTPARRASPPSSSKSTATSARRARDLARVRRGVAAVRHRHGVLPRTRSGGRRLVAVHVGRSARCDDGAARRTAASTSSSSRRSPDPRSSTAASI